MSPVSAPRSRRARSTRVLEGDPALGRLQPGGLEAPLHEDVMDAMGAVPGMGHRCLWTTITGSGRRARNSRMR